MIVYALSSTSKGCTHLQRFGRLHSTAWAGSVEDAALCLATAVNKCELDSLLLHVLVQSDVPGKIASMWFQVM